MNPLDRFPWLSADTRWVLELLSDGLDGKGAREVRANRTGLTVLHNGLVVCRGRNARECRANYEALRKSKS